MFLKNYKNDSNPDKGLMYIFVVLAFAFLVLGFAALKVVSSYD